jgi:hypothetical protein
VIDTTLETLITFSEATSFAPSRHPGCKLSTTTIWRWAEHGVRGIKLESVYVGGSRYTSREALARFAAATTAVRQGGTPAPPPVPVPAHRRRDRERVERALDEAGIGSAPTARRRGRKAKAATGRA